MAKTYTRSAVEAANKNYRETLNASKSDFEKDYLKKRIRAGEYILSRMGNKDSVSLPDSVVKNLEDGNA